MLTWCAGPCQSNFSFTVQFSNWNQTCFDRKRATARPSPRVDARVHSAGDVRTDVSRERELEKMINDTIPPQPTNTLPVVGLGGSAGSISALKSFFQAVPAETGIAFVVVIHLSPDHESTMAD